MGKGKKYKGKRNDKTCFIPSRVEGSWHQMAAQSDNINRSEKEANKQRQIKGNNNNK